ncbi:hypothetical protein [Thioalkalivibrio sp. ALE19]|uniref:hypothetical protein n=1 Tax=Thioalkalivibrio sp. ALE19 TaxID=1266909 RepID=UPI0012DCB453|nr:hypothetical protein [Thioalkalivibrio sp. ALE19]
MLDWITPGRRDRTRRRGWPEMNLKAYAVYALLMMAAIGIWGIPQDHPITQHLSSAWPLTLVMMMGPLIGSNRIRSLVKWMIAPLLLVATIQVHMITVLVSGVEPIPEDPMAGPLTFVILYILVAGLALEVLVRSRLEHEPEPADQTESGTAPGASEARVAESSSDAGHDEQPYPEETGTPETREGKRNDK